MLLGQTFSHKTGRSVSFNSLESRAWKTGCVCEGGRDGSERGEGLQRLLSVPDPSRARQQTLCLPLKEMFAHLNVYYLEGWQVYEDQHKLERCRDTGQFQMKTLPRRLSKR